MSLPWLQDDFEDSSRSRSRSPLDEKEVDKKEVEKREVDKKDVDKKEKILDTSAQSLPQKSARKFRTRGSRSKSSSNRRNSRRSRDSSHSRHSDRKKDRNSRHSKRKKRGNSSSSGSGSSPSYSSISSSSGSMPTRAIASTDPKYVKARLFVTNIVSEEIKGHHLISHFKKYGDVIDVILHVKNYAFIQFAKEEHAQLAIEGERGKTFRGWQIGVCLASERNIQMKDIKETEVISQGPRVRPRVPREIQRSQRWRQRQGGPPPHHGGPFPPPHFKGPHHGGPFPPPHFEGPFPPPHHGGPYPPPHGGPFPPHGGPFPPHGGPFPPHFRGPGPDSFHGRRPGPFGPGPGDFRGMDPYLEDPYRQGPPEPFRGDGPFRPDAFEGAYGGPPQPLRSVECEIFVMKSSLRAYGEYVEERIKNFNLVTSISITKQDVPPMQLLEDLRNHNVLFAVFIAGQNEKHKSVTLNVLYGSPQEHRNMPIDDAVSLIVDGFHKYNADLKEKEYIPRNPRASPCRSPDTLPAYMGVADLINLLADNRNLTVEDLDTIIHYLRKRRDKLVDPKGQSLGSKDKSPKHGRRSPNCSPDSRRRSLDSHHRFLDIRHRSLEKRHRSPEGGRQMSPEKDHRWSQGEGRHRPPDEGRHRPPDEGRRRSPVVGYRKSPPSYRKSPDRYRKSPDRYRKSPDRYRKSPPLDYEEVSQSPKEDTTAASKIPASLAEDLKSKIISILNSVRNAQSVPADGAQQQPNVPAGVSSAASQEQVPPPPPLPPSLPPLPTNELDTFTNSGAQDSGNMFQNSSGFVKTGFLDNVQRSNPDSAAQQQIGAVNEGGYQQGTWQSAYDQGAWVQGSEHNWHAPLGVEQAAPGTTGVAYQEAYNYSGSTNQMGNKYGQSRY